MSTLLIDELYPGVEFEQVIRITRDTNLPHVRLWIYKEGTLVDGDLTCEVLEGATVLATAQISYEDINLNITQNYAHGYIRFDFDSLELNIPESQTTADYTLRFTMQNHTRDESNYVAVSRDWERNKYPLFDTKPNDSVSPAGIELYEIRMRDV